MFRWFVKVLKWADKKIWSWKHSNWSAIYPDIIQFASSDVCWTVNKIQISYQNVTIRTISLTVCLLFIVGLESLQNHYYRYCTHTHTMYRSIIHITQVCEEYTHSNLIGIAYCLSYLCICRKGNETFYINLCFACLRTYPLTAV